jgi:hypothetical protein
MFLRHRMLAICKVAGIGLETRIIGHKKRLMEEKENESSLQQTGVCGMALYFEERL